MGGGPRRASSLTDTNLVNNNTTNTTNTTITNTYNNSSSQPVPSTTLIPEILPVPTPTQTLPTRTYTRDPTVTHSSPTAATPASPGMVSGTEIILKYYV